MFAFYASLLVSHYAISAGKALDTIKVTSREKTQAALILPRHYQIIRIDAAKPGYMCTAVGINNNKQVIGYCTDSDKDKLNHYGFLWDSGSLRMMPLPLGHASCTPDYINNKGEIVGQLDVDTRSCCFLYQNSRIDLIQGSEGQSIEDGGINNMGVIVGYIVMKDNGNHAIRYDNKTITDLGTLGFQNSEALGINDSGVIVGQAEVANEQFHAFLYKDSKMTDLGCLPGGVACEANAINANGIIAGNSYTPIDKAISDVHNHACLWKNGVIKDLGVLPGSTDSFASGINASGQIVGMASSHSIGNPRAFIWENGRMYDLNAMAPRNSGWILNTAEAINDKGYIVGSGVIKGEQEAFLLKPMR
jgi:probable HAF family extracellular repeat protein